MRLYHIIVIVLCATALGVATVWYESQMYQVGYKMGSLPKEKQEITEKVKNADVQLNTMHERDVQSLEKLNADYKLGLSK